MSDLRAAIRAEIVEVFTASDEGATWDEATDAVMAALNHELEKLRGQRDRAINREEDLRTALAEVVDLCTPTLDSGVNRFLDVLSRGERTQARLARGASAAAEVARRALWTPS